MELGLLVLTFCQFWPVPSMRLFKIVDIQDYPLYWSLVLQEMRLNFQMESCYPEVENLRKKARFLVENLRCRSSCIHFLLGIYLWQIVPPALMKDTILSQPKRREL